MPGAFHGINMASNALRAFQRGMDITGHNLANVSTRGYSRQVVEYKQNDPMSFWQHAQFSLGQGVSISSINRIRDQFLDSRMQSAQGETGRFETLATQLQRIEPAFNEPGPNGISAALDRFFNSWSGLASNPNDAASRIEVQQAGQTLANRIRSTFASLEATQEQLDIEINETANQINSLSTRIAELNKNIREQVATGAVPNDLLDQRDLAIEDLSKLVNVTTYPLSTGEVTVHFGGYPLVDSVGSHSFPKISNISSFETTDGTHTFTVGSGKLYGLMEASNKAALYKTQLDSLANELRTQINGSHMTGINQNSTTGIAFFNQNPAPPQNGARDFDLSAAIKSDFKNIAAGTTGKAGDGGLAISLSNIRNVTHVDLAGSTFNGFYTSMIASVGRDVEYAENSLNTQSAIIDQVESQRQSVSGVSIDDEMANMMKLQKSYQAAAKMFSVFDQVTEELIGLIR